MDAWKRNTFIMQNAVPVDLNDETKLKCVL